MDGKCFIHAELDRDHISIDAAHQFRGIRKEFVDTSVDGFAGLKLRAVFNSSLPHTETSINVPSKVTSDAMIRTPLRH
ncbi:MAG: hypothetical protein CBE16_06910 [Rhodospirillaceae bacterium TMED256]|nr:MAG: hypothetical protein CBE16_06910 [Rhodospirillaceae bacterium TMED256]